MGRGREIPGHRDLVFPVLTLLALLTLPPDASAQPQTPARDDTRVLVSRFVVTGVTVFPMDKLRPLLSPAEGRELTLAQIEAVAAQVTALYREHGYILARAYVPAQEMRDGVVQIAVLEGRVAKIDITALSHYTADYLRPYVEPRSPNRVFEAGDFERGLLVLNDLPGLSFKSTFKPGAETGTTDIVLEADKDRLLTGAIDSNNYGSPETGYERFGVSLNLNNPSGLGDVLAFRGLTSTVGGALWLARLSYAIPLNTYGTKLGGAYTHSHVGVNVGAVVGDLNVRGDADIGSLYLLHPFIRSREFSLYGQAGFDYKDFTNNFEVEQGGAIDLMGSSIVQNANVTTGGTGSVTATATTGGITMADGTVASAAGTGAVGYQAPGTITLGLLSAPGGAVTVNSTGGSILDGNTAALNIRAGTGATLNAGGVIGLLAAPIDVNVGGQVNVNAAGSTFNPPGPVIGTSINMAGVDVDDTLHFPTTVTGQIFWNGRLLWPLAPPAPVGRAAVADAATAALLAATPACDNPLAASEVTSETRTVLCHPAPTPSQHK